MFDREKSIADWRQQMLAAGIESPVPLEELEGHLREEIERQMRPGSDEQSVFETAVQTLGQPKPIRTEFKRIERNIMTRRAIIGIGVCLLLLGTAMILPALGKHKQRNQTVLATGAGFNSVKWAEDEMHGLALGIAVALLGAGATFYGFKERKA